MLFFRNLLFIQIVNCISEGVSLELVRYLHIFKEHVALLQPGKKVCKFVFMNDIQALLTVSFQFNN